MDIITTIPIPSIICAELYKRSKAYPKMVEKAKANGTSATDLLAMVDAQKIQVDLLEDALYIAEGRQRATAPIEAILIELERELTMRRKVYRRYVSMKWMTQEKANRQLEEWSTVIKYFQDYQQHGE